MKAQQLEGRVELVGTVAEFKQHIDDVQAMLAQIATHRAALTAGSVDRGDLDADHHMLAVYVES